MTNRKQFQFFPFHLVDMSPWPILTSFSAFIMAVSAVMCFHGFENGGSLLLLGFILTVSVMALWFKDVITEGRALCLNIFKFLTFYTLYVSKSVPSEYIEQALINFSKENKVNLNKDQFGYYLAGLLEGDGHISLPALGQTILNRVLNPRIIFTSHINNLGMYAYIQSELGGIGRF